MWKYKHVLIKTINLIYYIWIAKSLGLGLCYYKKVLIGSLLAFLESLLQESSSNILYEMNKKQNTWFVNATEWKNKSKKIYLRIRDSLLSTKEKENGQLHKNIQTALLR